MTNTRVAIAGLLVVAVIASAQPASVLTIDDAVALALKGNLQVQSAVLDVDRAREDTAALKTTRLPQFQIYALGGETLRPIRLHHSAGRFRQLRCHGTDSGAEFSITQPRQFAGFIFGQATQPLSQLWKIHLALISSQTQ